MWCVKICGINFKYKPPDFLEQSMPWTSVLSAAQLANVNYYKCMTRAE